MPTGAGDARSMTMSDVRVPDAASQAERIKEHAGRIRAAGALGRSPLLHRLFDLLLEHSLAGHAPKEAEIAEMLLARGPDFDATVDGSVRVAIHRLRRKLEDHYEALGAKAEERLIIPRGSYRLELVSRRDEEPDPAGDEVTAEPAPSRSTAVRLLVPLLVLLAIAGWGLALLPWRPAAGGAEAAGSPPWSALARSDLPSVIVVGDYYIFGEAGEDGQIHRLVREFAINSNADLDEYLMYNPDQVGRLRDINLSYLPIGTAAALRNIVPVVDAAAGREVPRARVITMSELTPAILKSSNIIYVGYLSRLGPIRNPLFAASRFEIGASYDELIDERSGTHYVADAPRSDRRTTTRDYGYLASLPGPSGNRIIIVAGTRDAALMQAAEMAADPREMARLVSASGTADAFEALYTVNALGNLNVDGKLSVAGPLRTAGVWDDGESKSFPDQLTAPDR